MKIVMLGAPGSGKGTHSVGIAEYYKIPHISTGDIFRDNISKKTPLGVKIKELIDAGNFVSDDITIEIVKNRLSEDDCKNGYLLDGFPRNLAQAKALDEFCPPDKIIELQIELDVLLTRLAGRRICSKCKKSFNTKYIGSTMICPDCGGDLYIRDDDNPESIKERLKIYNEQTAPLVDYYTKQGKVLVFDSGKEFEEVSETIKKALK